MVIKKVYSDLGWSTATVEEPLSPHWPRCHWSHGPGLVTVVTVMYCGVSPYIWPHSGVQNLLVVELPLVSSHPQQSPPHLLSSGDVDVVVSSPETSQDSCDVEWTISHDVELISWNKRCYSWIWSITSTSFYPVLHCSSLSWQYPTINISWPEHSYSWITQNLRWYIHITYCRICKAN